MDGENELLCQLPYRGYEVQVNKAFDSKAVLQYCGVVLERISVRMKYDWDTEIVPDWFDRQFPEGIGGDSPREAFDPLLDLIDDQYKIWKMEEEE